MDLPLVSRRAELAVLIGVIDAASPRPHLAASIAPVALVLTASRLATAVGHHSGLIATPDGFWDVVFPRYAERWPTWTWPSFS